MPSRSGRHGANNEANSVEGRAPGTGVLNLLVGALCLLVLPPMVLAAMLATGAAELRPDAVAPGTMPLVWASIVTVALCALWSLAQGAACFSRSRNGLRVTGDAIVLKQGLLAKRFEASGIVRAGVWSGLGGPRAAFDVREPSLPARWSKKRFGWHHVVAFRSAEATPERMAAMLGG